MIIISLDYVLNTSTGGSTQEIDPKIGRRKLQWLIKQFIPMYKIKKNPAYQPRTWKDII